MKTAKNPVPFLTLILTQPGFAFQQPKLCKTAVMAHRYFADKFTADLIHWLICFPGDWRTAAAMMEKHNPASGARLDKFKKWAARLTQPAKRGLLLEWKGGAL